jgi:hypothetical protein
MIPDEYVLVQFSVDYCMSLFPAGPVGPWQPSLVEACIGVKTI